MIEKGDKKGLSTIIANLLLVLLVLVAIGVIWVVVRNILNQGASEIGSQQFTFDASIQRAYVSGSNIVVGVRRNPGEGNLVGMKFLFLNDTGSVTLERRFFLNELEERTFAFTSSEVPGILGGDEVSIAPIFEASGRERVGDITDSARISETAPGPGGGGGGIGNPGSGTCGDSIIQSPNADNPPINEQCDGFNLNGKGCFDLGYEGGGTLSCTSGCQFDTSQCQGPVPPSCGDGVWNEQDIDDGNECDGTNGCSERCACENGFTPTLDGTGVCTLNPPVNTGIIFSVWNIFFDSNDLPKDDSVVNYIGDHVNFSSSPETRCFLITFADYVENKNISYLRLEDTPIFPNIGAGEGYSIWEAENCGQ